MQETEIQLIIDALKDLKTDFRDFKTEHKDVHEKLEIALSKVDEKVTDLHTTINNVQTNGISGLQPSLMYISENVKTVITDNKNQFRNTPYGKALTTLYLGKSWYNKLIQIGSCVIFIKLLFIAMEINVSFSALWKILS